MLTQKELKKLLYYDPELGWFMWRMDRHNGIRTGTIAGTLDKDGYIQLRVTGKFYKAHRLAFLYMTGRFPPNEVDHKYGDEANNRWVDLKEATKAENQHNQTRLHAANRTGFSGVYVSANGAGFTAYLTLDGRTIYIGTFRDVVDAHKARCKIKEKLHPTVPKDSPALTGKYRPPKDRIHK